jgi:hypothetical protein
MKKFIIRAFVLTLFAVVPFIVYLSYFCNGKSDPFYLKFTTPPMSSLILGTSRAAQGLQPSVFNESSLVFAKPMFNFGFTNNISPYGPIYLNAIKKKLSTASKNGLFILEVSPMSISVLRKEVSKEKGTFEEKNEILDNMQNFNMNPNYEYIFNYYPEPFYSIIFKNIRNDKNSFSRKYIKGFQNWASELREDGWLEVTVPMDSLSIKSRKDPRIETYKTYFPEHVFSPIRHEYLKKTIEYLSSYGKVYLVRVPVSPEMYELEKVFMPDFDAKMNQMSQQYSVKYINLIYKSSIDPTTDGNHLWKESGKLISIEILNNIVNKNIASVGEMPK